jgi:hypothetical protein
MELTIKLDENNKEAKALISYLKTLSYVSVKKEKKSPYNPEFVKKILERSENAAKGNYRVFDEEYRKELFGK